MEEFLNKHIKAGNLANGYILTGEVSPEELIGFLKGLGEVHFYGSEVGIDEIREIKAKAFYSKDTARRAFFVLNAENTHRLAYPALLKIIEEPPPGRHFFILSGRPEAIPKTVRSRLVEVSFGVKPESVSMAESFVKADYAQRAEMIEGASEDSVKFKNFLDELENWAKAKPNFGLLGRLQKAREASSVLNIGRKMCLEYLIPFINS